LEYYLLEIVAVFAERMLLVMLFLPFSALDKIVNFEAAIAQAAQIISYRWLARFLILSGLAIEAVMSLCILTGICDRLAALILAGYCIVTAVLWKRFWIQSDFRLKGKSSGRDMFWDFLKNIALAGGFLILAIGTTPSSVDHFFNKPLDSSNPYTR